jgi:hypothetical protein
MRLLILTLFLHGVCLAQSQDTLTCEGSCCCVNDLTPAGVMISHIHNKNEWMVSYRYMSMEMNGLLSGTQQKNKSDVFVNYLMSPEKMRMDMHMVMAMYGVTNRFTIMTMLNYNITTMSMSMLETTAMSHMSGMHMNDMNMSPIMKTSGISDLKLHLLYGLIKGLNHQLLLSTGFSFPTGNIDLKGKPNDMIYSDKRLPYAMQLGSGSFDILPCVNYLYQQKKIAFSIQGSGVVRTRYNNIGYKWGNEATLNSWFAYQWFNIFSTSVRLEGNIAGKIKGYDPTLYYYNEPSSNPFNYGEKRLNCFIGSGIQFKKGLVKNSRLGIEYGLPLYQSLNGTQMKLKQTLYASWAVTF